MFFQTGEFDLVPFPAWTVTAPTAQRATRARIAWRCFRVALHLGAGLLRAGVVLPFCSRRHVARQTRRWSQQLLRLLGVRVDIDHILRLLPMPGRFIVLNHISWLDVFVLNSVLPVRFVAKAEVRHWPLIGFLCQQAGTLFLDRVRPRAVATIKSQLLIALQRGELVAIFPEGTTTTGTMLKPFKSALFQSAIDAGTAVLPLVLQYRDAHGRSSDAAAYVGDMNLLQSIVAIASQRQLRARLTVLPAIASTACTRAELAAHTHMTMQRHLLC